MSAGSIVKSLGFGMGSWRESAGLEDLIRVLYETSSRTEEAVRLVNSAALLRRELDMQVHSDIHAGNVLATKEFLVLDLPQSTRAGYKLLDIGDWTTADPSEFRVVLEAAMENMVATSNAAAAMAQTIARQLVGDPGKLLSGTEFANWLGISEEAVRQRHQTGKLLAILKEGRERGRGFPIFQTWDGIAGEPLEQVFRAFGYAGPADESQVGAADTYQFFVSRSELLGGLTPVQILTGVGFDVSDQEATEFLAKPHGERLEFVKRVATLVAAQVRGE